MSRTISQQVNDAFRSLVFHCGGDAEKARAALDAALNLLSSEEQAAIGRWFEVDADPTMVYTRLWLDLKKIARQAMPRPSKDSDAGTMSGLELPDGAGIYFARFGDRLKIGMSRNIGQRLYGIRSSIGADVDLLAWEEPGHEDEVRYEQTLRWRERELHRQFADLRVCGEWFHFTGALVDHVRDVRKKLIDRLAVSPVDQSRPLTEVQKGQILSLAGSASTLEIARQVGCSLVMVHRFLYPACKSVPEPANAAVPSPEPADEIIPDAPPEDGTIAAPDVAPVSLPERQSLRDVMTAIIRAGCFEPARTGSSR
jgi:hypothetical protein